MTAISPSLPAALDHGAHAHAHGHDHAHEELSFVKKYLFSQDHKTIGLQFLFLGLTFFVAGGLLALVVRWQLAWPNTEVAGYKPVPILGRYLWSTFKADAKVGSVLSFDAATRTVVVANLADATHIITDCKPDDVATFVDAAGATLATGKIVTVAAEQVGVRLDEGQAVSAGAEMRGRHGPGVMPPDFYTMAFTMHATLMIFFVIIPLLVGTFGNFLIPLQIGARDMAMPFLNGVAFWTAVPAGAIIVASFVLPGGASLSGWTAYPPLSEILLNEGTLGYVAPNGAFDKWMMFLRLHNPAAVSDKFPTGTMGTWPPMALVSNYLALFLCFSYLATYYVRTGYRALNWVIALPLCAAGAVVALKAVQYLAFDGQSAWFLSIFLLGFSSIMGAVNYLTTIIKLRAPGMTMFRMPLATWSMFITSILVLLATPVLASALLMNLLDHHRLTNFFLPFNWVISSQPQNVPGGGYALLHQHLFWFYSHPAVYIMILPAMGMVSDIMAVFSRKPVFGYRPMVYALAGIAFLGFIVWAHHMFQSGMNPTLGTTFAISTMFIAVPSAIKTFNWLGTLWGGNIRFTTPMLHAVSFVAMFVIGGLSGIFMASTAVDVHIHDTYFIVAHIHYVLFGGSMFGLFAAITFWYPKMFGRMMNETAGKIHWFLSFVFFNGTFFMMHVLGIGGMARRIADYTNYRESFAHFLGLNQFITWCALGLGVAQVIFAINFIGSWIFGRRAGRNPWEATTLEWTTPSPPPHGNWGDHLPVVHHGPYEYSTPLVEEDYLPQTRWIEGADALAAVRH